MDGQLMDHPVQRRPDVDTTQLILRRHSALAILLQLGLDIAQLLGDLGPEILTDGQTPCPLFQW
jgi:hypothetical protein